MCAWGPMVSSGLRTRAFTLMRSLTTVTQFMRSQCWAVSDGCQLHSPLLVRGRSWGWQSKSASQSFDACCCQPSLDIRNFDPYADLRQPPEWGVLGGRGGCVWGGNIEEGHQLSGLSPLPARARPGVSGMKARPLFRPQAAPSRWADQSFQHKHEVQAPG